MFTNIIDRRLSLTFTSILGKETTALEFHFVENGERSHQARLKQNENRIFITLWKNCFKFTPFSQTWNKLPIFLLPLRHIPAVVLSYCAPYSSKWCTSKKLSSIRACHCFAVNESELATIRSTHSQTLPRNEHMEKLPSIGKEIGRAVSSSRPMTSAREFAAERRAFCKHFKQGNYIAAQPI